jgi:hypothetical protein
VLEQLDELRFSIASCAKMQIDRMNHYSELNAQEGNPFGQDIASDGNTTKKAV